MLAWLELLVAILSEVVGTLSLRASDGMTKWVWLIPVAVGYCTTFVFLALVLKSHMPVGVAYGIWSGIGLVLTAWAGKAFFGDPFTWVMGLGVVFICIGVGLLQVGAVDH